MTMKSLRVSKFFGELDVFDEKFNEFKQCDLDHWTEKSLFGNVYNKFQDFFEGIPFSHKKIPLVNN